MRWAIIVPFSKPSMLQTTLDNVARQYQAFAGDVCLVLVKNGKARSVEVPKTDFRVYELESAAHQSSARNAGLDYVYATGLAERIALFDCDDYYGPWFLKDQERYMTPGRLVGKRMHFIADERGLFLINEDWRPQLCSDITGACCVFYTEDATQRFPIMPIGEDTLFAYEWAQRAEVYASGLHHYCYLRGVENTWSVNIRHKLARSGIAIRQLGRFSAPIIDGVEPCYEIPLPEPSFSAASQP